MEDTANQNIAAAPFIAGIGASAGGLEPLEDFFRNAVPDSGIAYVVVQHLSPEFESLMGELLARKTDLPIQRAESGMPIEADHIYLISPKKDMTVEDDRLILVDRDDTETLHLPIDTFFRSLASNVGQRAIAVVLSGSGSDGSRSLVNVAEAGGLTVAQDPATAKFDGMPRSAINTGFVDWILPPDKMPAALARYVIDPEQNRALPGVPDQESSTDIVNDIMRMLRERFKLDFSYYKRSTITRRIERRLLIGRYDSIESYASRLHNDPTELQHLYQDLLICVTEFFRDEEAFNTLQTEAIDKILQQKKPGDAVRVWVAGCATGEEAYSIAMLIHERAEVLGLDLNLKLFATDIYAGSLEVASQGRYPEEIVNRLAPDRRDRYFTFDDGLYIIRPEIRQCIVFSQHNLIEDAPFTRVDLLSCRNLLIYLEPETQRKVLSLFHFALRVGGTLFLGASETLGAIASEFDVVDGHWKMFTKRRHMQLPHIERISAGLRNTPNRNAAMALRTPKSPNLIHAYDALLDDVVPAGILTDREGQVLHVFGAMENYFSARTGRPTSALPVLVRPELKLAINAALQRTSDGEQAVALGPFSISVDDELKPVTISCKALSGRGQHELHAYRFFRFDHPHTQIAEHHEAPPIDRLATINIDAVADERIQTLETELQQSREHLQSVIEELETSNEELQSTNEELVSSNEELQSTNEELHSVNEELYTVNAEYQQKIVELTELSNDINNLISSTEIGLVFLDPELTIRRFTPAIRGAFNLRATDIGRPISDISHNLKDVDVLSYVRDVQEDAEEREEQVVTADGTPFLMRVRPYRDEKERIAGVVLTFIDLTQVRSSEAALRQSEQRFRTVVENSPNALLMVDERGTIALANGPANTMFGYAPNELVGQSIEKLVPAEKATEHKELRRDYLRNPIARPMGADRMLSAVRKDGSEFPVEIALNAVQTPEGLMVLSSIADISERIRAQQEIKNTQARLYYAIQAGNIGLWDWNVDTGQVVVNDSFLEQLGKPPGESWENADEWFSHLHPDDCEHAMAKTREFIDGHAEEYRSVFRLRHANGTYRWILSVGGWLRGLPDDSRQLAGAHIDITDRMEHQEELERYARALEESNRELDEFSYIASHDLQEPLRKLISYTRLLEQDVENENKNEIKNSLRVITNSASRMRSLVQDLLVLSRTGKAELNCSKTRIADCIKDALEAASSSIAENNAEISFDNLPEVECDRTLVTQLYQNLISNALKFRADDRAPQIRFTAIEENDEIVLGVEDNGVGIKEDYRDLVFAPFKRLQGRSKADGTGIGLTICRKAVERHGGRMWVESTPGSGSHFRFAFKKGGPPAHDHANANKA